MVTTPQRPGKDSPALATHFTKVYNELSPRVLGYLRSHGVEDPESVTQDVFLSLYRRFDRITGGEDAVRTLTFSIAHARMVDHTRARARRPYLVEFEAESDPRTSASAEEMATDLMSERGVASLLERLVEDQRDAVLLRIVAGLSLEETAMVMGKSIGAVKQLQRRALDWLRTSVSGDHHD